MQLLQPALNVGLAESDFWDMTKAEVERYMEGAVWRLRMQAQFDYKLADLIGVSVARLLDKDVNMPGIKEAYAAIFDEESEEEKQAKQQEANMENSINRFLAFAQQHNARHKGVENSIDDN